MRKSINLIFGTLCLVAAIVALSAQNSQACSNVLVTKGASKDGSVMVTYSADAHVLYGELYHTPAGLFPKGSILKIFEWDTGKYSDKNSSLKSQTDVLQNLLSIFCLLTHPICLDF